VSADIGLDIAVAILIRFAQKSHR